MELLYIATIAAAFQGLNLAGIGYITYHLSIIAICIGLFYYKIRLIKWIWYRGQNKDEEKQKEESKENPYRDYYAEDIKNEAERIKNELKNEKWGK